MQRILRMSQALAHRPGQTPRIGNSLLVWAMIGVAVLVVVGIATGLVTADWSDE